MRNGLAPRYPVAGAACLVLLVVALAGCRSLIPRQYEYEEEIYLSLDGTATMYVNGSVAALVALRGLDLDPGARVDRNRFRRLYESAVTHVTRVSTSRRAGRRFAHLRIEVADVRRLAEAAPFAWSAYRLERTGEEYVYTQAVGPSARRDVGDVGWRGSEIVAFRMHLPSRIRYHDAPSRQVERGNILTWEQTLADRLAGKPLRLEVRLDTQSILYRTLWLFSLMIVLVLFLFAALLWWIRRRGREHSPAATL